ncbi:hypothetical protein [Mucilaginibacter celer]|nr:hypothetical protein [Mucilaginibacter celer]
MEPLQFKLDPLQYPALQKKMLIRSVSLVTILLIALSVYTMRDANNNDVTFWVGYLIFMILLYSFLMSRAFKKRRKIYESYSITIGEQGITRKQDKWADLYIPLTEITAIEKKTNGNFVIKGISNDPLKKINIIKQIEDYERLEEVLANIKPITLNVKTLWWEKYSFLLSLIIVIPLLGVYVVDNKIVVGISAAISVATLVYIFFNILKYRNSVKSLKRSLWTIPLIIISVLVVAYFKLIA